jgi:predicted transcriptional regulator
LGISESTNKTVAIKGLAEGRTCMYRIKSTCGKIKVKHQTMREVLSELKEKNDYWNDKDKKAPEP